MKKSPAKKRDWSKIADELCLCGRKKSEHAGALQSSGMRRRQLPAFYVEVLYRQRREESVVRKLIGRVFGYLASLCRMLAGDL